MSEQKTDVREQRKAGPAVNDAGLPASLLAEQSVIGAILQCNAALGMAALVVRAEDFSTEAHRRIVETLSELIGSGAKVDAVVLAETLESKGLLESVGGVGYLVKMQTGTPSAANVQEYAKRVADMASERRMVLAAEKILAAQKATIPTEDKLRLAKEASLDLFFDPRPLRTGPRTMADLLRLSFRDIEQRASDAGEDVQPTGYAPLDEVLGGGLVRGEVIALAARARAGVTSLALSIAENVAVGQDKSIAALFITPKISASYLALNSLARLSGVALSKIRKVACNAEEKESIEAASKRLGASKLLITDLRKVTFNRLKRAIVEFSGQHGMPRLVVLDAANMLLDGSMDQETVDTNLAELADQIGATIITLYALPDSETAPTIAEFQECWNPGAAALGVMARTSEAAATVTVSRQPFVDAQSVTFGFVKETLAFTVAGMPLRAIPVRDRHAG